MFEEVEEGRRRRDCRYEAQAERMESLRALAAKVVRAFGRGLWRERRVLCRLLCLLWEEGRAGAQGLAIRSSDSRHAS